MSGAATVRDATAADLPRLVALEAALFGGEAWDDPSLRAELDGPGRRLLVVAEPDGAGTSGEQVLAYAATMVLGDVADLLRIGVDPEQRRRGHARRLLRAVVAHARAAGAARLLLEVGSGNSAALALYRAAGLEVVDTRPRYYRDGSDALVLALDR